ncbi:MAG: hemolysin family protein [Clostridiales bacterium]|nr:hemolysin family protein [Clostridiales bacterium]
MDNPGDLVNILCLIVLLMLSSFFSGAETALTTTNKIRMRSLADSGDKRAETVLRITSDSGKMLSAILIGNNIVNLFASSLVTSFTIKHFGGVASGIATGILTFVILVFGEVTPKTMSTIRADKISLAIAGVISALMTILTPVIFIINWFSMGVLFLLRVNPKEAEAQVTEDEIRTIVDVGQESGAIEDEERDIIHNLFDLGDTQVKEMMIPRMDVTYVQIDATYDEVIELFRETKFTRVPVYETSTDEIVGLLNIKDLLLLDDKDSFSIRSIMREPFFTYTRKNASELFLEMRQSALSTAIVLDEYGATAGFVTLEDLLEEIVGDIRDEFDADKEDSIHALSELEYLVQGSENLDDINTALGISLESEDYDSLGGLCLEILGHLPKLGECFTTDDGCFFRIERMDKNRVDLVFIRLPEPKDEDEDGSEDDEDESLVDRIRKSGTDKSSGADKNSDKSSDRL